MITEYRGCRVCGARLQTVLEFGAIAVSAFPAPDEPDGLQASLDWCRCARCGLVQLRHAVDPQYLYQEQPYWYRSGVNETMVAELQDVVRKAVAWIGDLPYGATVVDIGANDGTLLKEYQGRRDLQLHAYEPSPTFAAALGQVPSYVYPCCFPPNAVGQVPANPASIVTTIACFYDTNHPVIFAKNVALLLHKDGVWVLQFQDLHQMLQSTAYDNICHEHVFYPSLAAIERIVNEAGLVVTHVEPRAINGGSLRVYVQHRSVWAYPDYTVKDWRLLEAGCENVVTLETFAHRVQQHQQGLRGLLRAHLDKGQTVDLYAASTKANTMLQTCGLWPPLIRQAWERSPEKWGRETVGTRIPIVSEADGRADPPDALLVGAWQFRKTFLEREKDYLASGRPMIFPLPKLEVVQTRVVSAEEA